MDYLLLQTLPSTPDIIESQGVIVQIVYLFGSVIVLGMVAAILYLRNEILKKDVVIENKDNDIKELTDRISESEKANLVVLKDIVTYLGRNGEIGKEIKELIDKETNPKIIKILHEIMNLKT